MNLDDAIIDVLEKPRAPTIQWPEEPTLRGVMEEIELKRRNLEDGLGYSRGDNDRSCQLQRLSSLDPQKILLKRLETYRDKLSQCQRQEDKWKSEVAEYDRRCRVRSWEAFAEAIGRRYAACTFDAFIASADVQREVLRQIREYAGAIEANCAIGRNVVLYGPVGTGKDHLLASLSRDAILEAGLSVWWSTGANVSDMNNVRGGGSGVVYISDPAPPGGASYNAAKNLYKIVDSAYRDSRPVWISINAKDRKQAAEMLGMQVIDRIWDERAVALHCNWPSYRRPRT